MERRKILLGSGTALTTALAGCFGSETSDDDGAGDNGDNDDNDNGYDNDDKDDKDDHEPKVDDIPGYDGKKLDLDSDYVWLKTVEREDRTVSVVAGIDTTDREKLHSELEPIADKHDTAMVDVKKFKNEIDKLDWTVEHDGEKVAAFTVEVSWVVDLYKDEISKKEFEKKVENEMK